MTCSLFTSALAAVLVAALRWSGRNTSSSRKKPAISEKPDCNRYPCNDCEPGLLQPGSGLTAKLRVCGIDILMTWGPVAIHRPVYWTPCSHSSSRPAAAHGRAQIVPDCAFRRCRSASTMHGEADWRTVGRACVYYVRLRKKDQQDFARRLRVTCCYVLIRPAYESSAVMVFNGRAAVSGPPGIAAVIDF